MQHSALSNTERLLQWQQIQNGGADIVVGTRSAVFAPLPDIGVIIIDEEQEHTYHLESAPRYSAHDVAKRRAAAHGARCCWPRPRPPTESYYAAQAGRYTLVELSERYNQCRCRRCGWWTCARNWAAGTHRPSAGRWRMKFGAQSGPGRADHPSFEPSRIQNSGHVHRLQ